MIVIFLFSFLIVFVFVLFHRFLFIALLVHESKWKVLIVHKKRWFGKWDMGEGLFCHDNKRLIFHERLSLKEFGGITYIYMTDFNKS